MARLEPQPIGDEFQTDPAAWFVGQARDGMAILLAHADDGVIWGEVRDGALVLAGSAFPRVAVLLRASTLQQARLFGPTGELRVWRDEKNGFCGVLIRDEESDEVIAEEQWLWGTRDSEPREKFTLLREGSQGMLHAPPLDELRHNERAVLKVRHYITADEQGVATIQLSRLAGLDKQEDRNG